MRFKSGKALWGVVPAVSGQVCSQFQVSDGADQASTLAEVLAPLLGQQPHIFAEALQQARERCMASMKVLVLGECGDGKSTWAIALLVGCLYFAESLRTRLGAWTPSLFQKLSPIIAFGVANIPFPLQDSKNLP